MAWKPLRKIEGEEKMAVSYNRLFKLMIDRKMRKKDLCELAGVKHKHYEQDGAG